MAGAFGYERDRHARAWQWLNEQDADVALLQEVVPHPEEMGAWGSLIFRGKYKQHGCAVLVKAGGYRAWEPTDQELWLKRVGGAAAIARPEQESGFWFISVTRMPPASSTSTGTTPGRMRIYLRVSRSPGAAPQRCGRSNQSPPSFGRS
jgi:hypothetical protein